jgi:hypothetical protein
MTVKSFSISVVPALAGSLLLLVACGQREDRHEDHPRSAVDAPAEAGMVGAGALGTETVVNEAPPAPLTEVVMSSPGPDFAWIGGVWVWNNRWVWEAGRWDRRPSAGAAWVPHKYENRNGKHVFVRGGWK